MALEHQSHKIRSLKWRRSKAVSPGLLDFFKLRPPRIRPRRLLALPLLLIAFLLTGLGAAQSHNDPMVVMNTTKGTIVIRVYVSMAPNTAANFLDLVGRGFYNGLSFHRVESWVVQGGDPNGNGTGNFIDPETGQARLLRLEASPYLHHNAAGVVAMAHARSPNSGSCQFYITKKAAPALDGGYSIFGGVIRGMDAVYNMQIGDRILSAEIVTPNSGNRPSQGSSAPARQPSPYGDSGF